MRITDELVDYLGQLSRLEISEEEKAGLKSDLTDILNYMDKLAELDTMGKPEMSHPFMNTNCFREDVVTNQDDRSAVLSNAPAKNGDYFKVHKTVGEEV